MRVGLTYEHKSWYPFEPSDPPDANSELFSDDEEQELIEGLREAGHEVVIIGDAARLLKKLDYWREACDIVFNRSVGYRGAERKSYVPAILESAGMPYIGSTPYVLSLTRNKYHTKMVIAEAGIPTPPAAMLCGGLPDMADSVTYPAIMKPVAESSSIGIESGEAIVATPAAARKRAEVLARNYAQPAIAETFIEGIEVEVPVVVDPEPRVLGLAAVGMNGHLLDGNRFLASDEVYDDGYDFVPVPSWVDAARLTEYAERGARALGIRDYGRLDFRIDAQGTPWFIEASTHPHVQRLSSFYVTAQWQGKSYADMLDMLVQVGARRSSFVQLRQ
jgi:D-alanine-D-alanine ligase